MKDMIITVVENGFIVTEDQESPYATTGKQHVFQTAQGLAEFVHKWGDNIKKPSDDQQ